MRYTISSRHGQKATSLACQDHTALVASTSPGGNYVSHKYSWMIASEERLRCLLRVEEVDARKQVVARFQPALTLAWELAETDSLLARELAKCREASAHGKLFGNVETIATAVLRRPLH
ncbi:MULE transposase [Hirsutella rhossiliensis]